MAHVSSVMEAPVPADSRSARGHRTFDHTADIGVEAWSRTFEEALAEVGLGLQAVIVHAGSVRPAHSRKFTVEATDEASLVVAWLSELLFAFEVDGWLSTSIDVSLTGASSLVATCVGESFDEARHETGVGVKAVSYHQLSVQHDDSGVHLRVILDV